MMGNSFVIRGAWVIDETGEHDREIEISGGRITAINQPGRNSGAIPVIDCDGLWLLTI